MNGDTKDDSESTPVATGDTLDHRNATFPIVGIGASAGGLEALELFFANLPVDTGMPFIVVQHLSPDFKSLMDELLARHTSMTIHRVTDGMEVEPNAIYLIPPKKEMIISNGKLLLSDKDPNPGLALPIDIFFRSLAQDAGNRAVAVILSGTGSDGSRGIVDIRQSGGLVIAQDPESAKFDGMPKSAIETGVTDLILPPEQIPQALLAHAQHPGADGLEEFLPADPALLEGYDAIFQLLRKSYDIDFTYYKRSTVSRRVHRRLLMNQITDLEDYVNRLRNDAEELNLLYKDLLIGVTQFFRDPQAFLRLEQDVLPQLLAKIHPEGELRIWVAGCATGEEAYTLAILVDEQLERINKPVKVKIFATDVHRGSLDCASAGIYSESSVTEVSPARLERYFTRCKGGYQVSQDLRQLIVFAPHNLIKDAPFTKLDLITCRNMLIYLEGAAQKKVLSLFHFGLNTGGVLFLGSSESPGDLIEEFDAIDGYWKIYRKRRDRRLPVEMRLPLTSAYANPPGQRGLAIAAPPAAPAPDAPLTRAYDELLKDYAPPCLLINNRRELIQSFGGGSEYLKMRDGRPTRDILDLVVPELRTPLATAIHQVSKTASPIAFDAIPVSGNRTAHVRLSIKPVPHRNQDEQYFLVALEKIAETQKAPDRPLVEFKIDEISRDQIQSLEGELSYTKETLQATLEEMETSNEELQATNEELVASNEELQSTNEELHSVNEELYTVNGEYQKKITELTEMTADMDNLLRSTDVGVIFLDHEMCIRKFTPKIAAVLNLLPVDIGRRIDTFAKTIDYGNLLADTQKVLQDGIPIEREIQSGNSQASLLRILPYRTQQKLEGAVILLIDISQLKRAETKLRLMSKVFTDASDPIILEDLAGLILDVNAEAERVYGWTRDEMIGRSFELVVPESERPRARELRARCLEKGGLRNIETIKVSRNGTLIPMLLTLSVLTDMTGNPVVIASSCKDITDRKRAELAVRDSVEHRDRFLAMLSHELRNPIGAALNATYLLEREPHLSEMGTTAGRVIQRQINHVARLLDDLLDVSRVTQGRIDIRRQVVDLTQLVDDAVQAVKPTLISRGHELAFRVSPIPLYVEGDAARLVQIYQNLLSNAIKYTPPGGKIEFRLSREGDEIVLRVRDNGRGIPEHMLESIFDLFVQSDDTLDRTQGGMGLGLTLVKTLVELHHGEVTAHSDGPGQGSEFVVRLPRVTADDAAPDPEADAPPAPAFAPRRVVLVEDNDVGREMLGSLLKLDGHDVITAHDGSYGLELILMQRPDVAIIDIGLPGMNGYAVARHTRERLGDDICLIALTGYGRAEDREAVRQAGFDLHLVKPLKPEDLAHALSTLCREPGDYDGEG